MSQKVNREMLAALTVTEVVSLYGGVRKVAFFVDQRTGYRYTLEKWSSDKDGPNAYRRMTDSFGRMESVPQNKRTTNTLKLALFPETL